MMHSPARGADDLDLEFRFSLHLFIVWLIRNLAVESSGANLSTWRNTQPNPKSLATFTVAAP